MTTLPEPTFLIFNPSAGRGRGQRLVAPLLQALDGCDVRHALSSAAGHESDLAQKAVEDGFTRIVAIGGDGTWSNVANGLLRAGRPARLALVAGGTGCDFAKTVGTPAGDLAASVQVIRAGVTKRVDVGRVEGRYFLNLAGFGYDVAVLEASWKVNWLKGDLRYVYCAALQIGSYPGFQVGLQDDSGKSERRDLLMLIVANARHFGGQFRIAPHADLTDGRLDVVAFSNARAWRRPALMSGLMRGTHLGSPGVTSVQTARLRLEFEQPPAYETDGEWNRARSATLEIETVAGAIDVLVPAGSA
jgi:diacylglycerol kinase (ATP)